MKFWLKPFFALFILLASGQAFASCAAQDMAGTWNNTDRNTGGITKLQLHFACNDTVHNGVPANRPDTLRVWGACSPRDCDWGTVNLRTKFWDGRQRQTSYVETSYHKGFATTHLKIYRINRNRLMAISLTDFSANNRPDYSSIAYFQR